MFCVSFAGCLKIIAPGVGVLARFSCPRGRGFALSLCSGRWSIRPFKKIPGGDGQAWNSLIHHTDMKSQHQLN